MYVKQCNSDALAGLLLRIMRGAPSHRFPAQRTLSSDWAGGCTHHGVLVVLLITHITLFSPLVGVLIASRSPKPSRMPRSFRWLTAPAGSLCAACCFQSQQTAPAGFGTAGPGRCLASKSIHTSDYTLAVFLSACSGSLVLVCFLLPFACWTTL